MDVAGRSGIRALVCVSVATCGRGDHAPAKTAGKPALTSPVACYEGRTTIPRPDRSSPQDLAIVIKRTVDPAAQEIDEQVIEFPNAQLEFDLVEHVVGNAFTFEERNGLYRGTGTMEAGSPWGWTAWSWTVRGGDLNIESHYQLTPEGLSIHRITPEFDAREELQAFDCSDYSRRISTRHAQLFGQ
jgi:hypothetical protein